MNALRSSLALLAVVLAGLGIVEAAFRESSGDLAERGLRFSLAAVGGLGLWSSTYAVALFTIGTSTAVLMLKDSLLALGGAALLIRVRPSPAVARAVAAAPAGPRWAGRALALLFGVAVLIAVIVFVIRVMRTPDGFWDAWAIWNLRARFFVRVPGDLALALSPELGWNTHQDYPLMLPGLTAQAWSVAGYEWLAAPAILGGLFALGVTATLTSGVTLLRGAVTGVTAGLVLLGTSAFLRMASHQVADVPLATFALMASVLVAVTIEQPDRPVGPLLVLAGVIASMGAWTKNEGILHAVALMTALFFFQSRSTPLTDRVRQLGWFASGALPIVALLTYFKLAYAPPNDLVKDSSVIEIIRRAAAFPRYQMVLGALWQRVQQVNDWNSFLALLPLFLIGFRRRQPFPPAGRVALAAALLVLGGFVAVYLLTPRDLDWHLRTSMDRVLMQWWPSFIFATFLALPSPEAHRLPLARHHPPHKS